MKTTKLVIGASLMIALATAAMPAVSAETPVECVSKYTPLIGSEPQNGEPHTCIVSHVQDECAPLFGPTVPELLAWSLCLAGVN